MGNVQADGKRNKYCIGHNSWDNQVKLYVFMAIVRKCAKGAQKKFWASVSQT